MLSSTVKSLLRLLNLFLPIFKPFFIPFLQNLTLTRSASDSECSLIVVCTLIGCCRFKNVFWPRHQNKQIGSFDVSKTHTIYGHLLTFYVFSVTVNIYIDIIQLEKYFVAPQLRLKFRKLAQGRDMHPTSSNCTIVNITTYILLTMNEMNECYVSVKTNASLKLG